MLNTIAALTATNSLRINSKRLMQMMADMGAIGALPNGGVRRLAFSPEDRQGRQLAQRWMEAAGMTVGIDTAGNMIGRYAGRFPHAPALATGSHLDTVP
ncbi:MAG: Zn-dependent hydrolase, partial [Symploca sp. SIO2G7]|nr:Zn-dependent hydrolase [Symploca sp. SIO2G7]